jgi:LytS/YehU family sensor histidine kinase
MEHVDAYVALSKILPSRDFDVQKDFQVTDFYLPALVIQPLVENAIYYGIAMSTEGEVIRLQTMKDKGYIIIKVIDDAHGKQTKLPTQKKHKSVGTQNVKTRLKILCDGELTIDKKPEGTEAIIRIPETKAVPKPGKS